MRTRSTTTHNEILLAARKHFLAHGYSSTTLNDIAQSAGLTKRTIYGYFSDKRSLLRGVVEQVLEERWDSKIALSKVETKQELQAALLTLAVTLEDVITQVEYVQLLRIAVTEVRSQPGLTLLFDRSVTHQSYKLAMQLFQEAVYNHVISPASPELIAKQFVGSFAIRILLDGLLQPHSTIKKQSKRELEAYVDSFINQISKD